MITRSTKRTVMIWLLSLLSSPGLLLAQDRQNFSLNEAIRFAVEHNINVKNSVLDAQSAEGRIRELRGVALPQVSASGQVMDNLIIQRVFLPAVFFDPKASPDAPAVPVQFGVNYSGSLTGNLSQLLFDASYRLGLRAADTYRQLAQKNIMASKVTVAEQVAKAYYSVLVNEQQLKLLDLNISRVDTLYQNTLGLNKQGFAEKIDVSRLEVQVNNLKAERQNVQNLIELSYYLLKFQMGLGINDNIALTEDIKDIDLDEVERTTVQPVTEQFDYNQRIEFATLQSQIELADLDVQSVAKRYYPTLSAFANYGYNTGRNQFSHLFTDAWFNSSAVGINLSIPIFDGFQKRYQAQQKRFTLQKTQNSSILLKNSIDLQIRQASVTIKNSLQTLRTQKRNVELAKEVARVTKIKYQEGVGSNIEVLDAENSYRQAQNNYFVSLYNFLQTKVDADKASGKLYSGQ
ncbi:TolC family protein [Spirosoma endbachense]|uniref:TolC family protein n=1 Tax=Spirosoma endbachense TaxID=2666025 RepID=A0A6P1VUN3_9BACT|nr:TolC family protein [Spirosoma endbachense]QHV95457.1 TolC family protein [Spirosoma endbachense]